MCASTRSFCSGGEGMKDYPAIGERLYRRVLPNGLTVLVVPRPGFTRKSAYFVTNFGSLHTDFRFKGKEYHAPAGVAHYLEHKMFDLPGHDVYPEFAAMGASANRDATSTFPIFIASYPPQKPHMLVHARLLYHILFRKKRGRTKDRPPQVRRKMWKESKNICAATTVPPWPRPHR